MGKKIEYYCVVADERSAIILQSLTEQQKNAMNFIAWKMDEDGIVALRGRYGAEMMGYLNVKSGRFYQLLRQLTERGIIRKYGGGDYIVNPSLYFKGKASDIGRKMSIYNYKIENDGR